MIFRVPIEKRNYPRFQKRTSKWFQVVNVTWFRITETNKKIFDNIDYLRSERGIKVWNRFVMEILFWAGEPSMWVQTISMKLGHQLRRSVTARHAYCLNPYVWFEPRTLAPSFFIWTIFLYFSFCKIILKNFYFFHFLWFLNDIIYIDLKPKTFNRVFFSKNVLWKP